MADQLPKEKYTTSSETRNPLHRTTGDAFMSHKHNIKFLLLQDGYSVVVAKGTPDEFSYVHTVTIDENMGILAWTILSERLPDSGVELWHRGNNHVCTKIR